MAAASAPPNIIVIVTDDLGYADLGVQGAVEDIRTPNLDAMAKEGIRCTSGYVTAPQCSPSRAGLLTGRYQQRLGIDQIPDMPLPLNAVTIAERLRPAGYTSAMIGKWHLEPNEVTRKWMQENGIEKLAPKDVLPFFPAAQGFDFYYKGERQTLLRELFARWDSARAGMGQPAPVSGGRANRCRPRLYRPAPSRAFLCLSQLLRAAHSA